MHLILLQFLCTRKQYICVVDVRHGRTVAAPRGARLLELVQFLLRLDLPPVRDLGREWATRAVKWDGFQSHAIKTGLVAANVLCCKVLCWTLYCLNMYFVEPPSFEVFTDFSKSCLSIE